MWREKMTSAESEWSLGLRTASVSFLLLPSTVSVVSCVDSQRFHSYFISINPCSFLCFSPYSHDCVTEPCFQVQRTELHGQSREHISEWSVIPPGSPRYSVLTKRYSYAKGDFEGVHDVDRYRIHLDRMNCQSLANAVSGEPRRCEERLDEAKRRVLEMEFSSADSAKSVRSGTVALCAHRVISEKRCA